MAYNLTNNNNLFDNMVNRVFGSDFPTPNFGSMKTDISETDNGYEVKIEMPGLKKDDISINYDNGVLQVSGLSKRSNDNKDDQGTIIRSERSYGSYSRQYSLPNVNRDDITARYDGGILTIDLPKQSPDQSGDHQIKID